MGQYKFGKGKIYKKKLRKNIFKIGRFQSREKCGNGSIFIAAILCALLLCACGEQEVTSNSQSSGNLTEQETSAAQSSNDVAANTLAEAAKLSGKELYQGIYRSCILQEDEEYLYLCGSHRISRIHKTTQKEEILWQNRKQASESREYLYRYGSAILLDDKIYFIERWYDAMQQEYRALSMVHTDGSGYERIAEMDWYCCDGMLLENGLLYLDGDNKELCYLVYADGTLSEVPETIDALDRNQIFYDLNGDRVLFEHEDIAVHRENSFFNAYNDKYLLFSEYDKGRRYLLIDRKSGEELEIGLLEDTSDVVYMDNSYIYAIEMPYEENSIRYIYKRYNLETGEWQTLFTQEKQGFGKYVSRYLMDVVIKDEFIYYVDESEGKYYLMRRNVNLPEEAETVWDAFYDTGIDSIGYIEEDYQEFYIDEKKENTIFILNLSWMQVNDSFAGADAINNHMKDYMDSKRIYAQEVVAEMKEWGNLENIVMPGELDSGFTGFQYFDSRYISFYQAEHQYMSGAAHGMPYWNGFTFDLQTGKCLYLDDIINNSEAELKEIVTDYFAEMIYINPEAFWADAVEYVREDISFESDFYMTEEGFVFFYEPYALACYAAGFQSVTIPYAEFDMKISLEKAVKAPEGEGWGLSFGEAGVQPTGNFPVEELEEYNGYYMGDDREKVIYLTFDCGYENGNTEALLEALKKHDVKATFFVVGHFLETAPELVKRMTAEGHTVGNHTYHHPDVTSLDKQAFCEEMNTLAVKFKEVTGEELDMYYRPPEGKCSVKNMRWASELGYSTIFWSLAHVDWDTENQPKAEEAVEKLTARLHPGAVVLLHNTSATNAEILDELLTKWEALGYEVRPLAELVEKEEARLSGEI